MKKVYFPVKDGQLTQGFSSTHRGYDIGPRGNNDLYAANTGTIKEAVGKYTTNWINGFHPDPTPSALTTEDYGNYIKVTTDDGEFDFYAHLEPFDSTKVKGIRVSQGIPTGLIVGNIGNSTGRHVHYEHRNSSNQRVEVEFIKEVLIPMDPEIIKRADAFVAVCDVLGKAVDKDIVIEDIKRLRSLEERLIERDKELSEKSRELEEIAKNIKELTEENNILKDSVEKLSQQAENQGSALKTATEKIEELQKIKPVNDYTGQQLIVKGILKLLGR